MRIAYVAHIRFPSERAHAIQIVHMANAFAAEGHKVELFVSTRATAIKETPEEYYGVRFLFTLTRVPIIDIIARIHSFPKFVHALLYNLERLLFVASFAWHHRAQNYDLLYCRDEFVLGCLSFLYPRARIVWESHEGKENFFARRLLRRAHTVVISEGIKARYHSSGFDGTRIVVAHDAIDDSFFEAPIEQAEARRRLGLEEGKPIVMYIGGFDRWKGVHTLFEAAALMPDARVVAIGGTPEMVEALRPKYPRVRFLGSRPYRELSQNQQGADILVIPNTAKNALSAEFTSPLKLFSHMASRVPIVLSDIQSLRAVLGDDAGYFFTPDDPQALAYAVTEVLQDKTRAKQKADAAYEKSKQYTWRKRAAAIIAALA
jgi:glycosyltransferase involved in cell wall biosynthesis